MPLLCFAMIAMFFAMLAIILRCLLCSCDVLLRFCYKLLCFLLCSAKQADMAALFQKWSRNRHGHFYAVEGVVSAVAFGIDDAVGNFHAADDFSESRVLTIQER